MGVPTAVLMLLSGELVTVPVTLDAIQPPPGTGGISGAFLVAEHVATLTSVPSVSLPELSRRIPSTRLWYDFASGIVKGISPVDGGYYLRPGLTGHLARPVGGADDTEFSIDLRYSNDDLGHVLPVPAGTRLRIELRSYDGQSVAWAGEVVCTSQSSDSLPPSLSLKELRGIVELDRGSVRVIIPESSTSLGLSLLAIFMTIFYLFIVLAKLHAIDVDTAVGKDVPTSLKLFLMNGPTNAVATAISGLIISGSTIQTFRETAVLVYGFSGTAAVVLGVWYAPDDEIVRLPTIRVVVESSLLASIALPMGVFSKIAQFSAALLGLAIVVIALIDVPTPGGSKFWRRGTFPHRSVVVDLVFRAGSILILAPVILFPVSLASSIEYQGSIFLIYPTIVLTLMSASVVAHTWLGRGESRPIPEADHTVTESVLFSALTILLKSILIGPVPTLPE